MWKETALDLRKAREISGLSQFAAAQKSGIPRMRLSLAECGQIHLKSDEELALRHVLRRAIEQRAAYLQDVLSTITRQEIQA
jgi:transcriptional regulator with XRE-family HTH domain